MRTVFWLLAALCGGLAVVTGVAGLSALAEAERLRNPASAALGAAMLAAAGPAALLALAAAGFASLLGRLDAILEALHERPAPARAEDRPLFRRDHG